MHTADVLQAIDLHKHVCPEPPVCASVRIFLALLVHKYKYWQRDIARTYAMRRVLRQYLHFRTSKASKLSTYGMRRVPRAARARAAILGVIALGARRGSEGALLR